jgi:hypothetical protein
LHAIWTAETRDARHDRYRQMVMAALPPGQGGELSHRARCCIAPCTLPNLPTWTSPTSSAPPSHPATWPDPATSPPSSTPAYANASILWSPPPQDPWTSRVPQLPDPARQAYLAGIAALMDDRTRRLGQRTAQTVPTWAIKALGPVPADPAARQDWACKAAPTAVYREMYGYDHPGDPIGPEPSHQAPDQRAAWYQAFLALNPAAGPDVRAMPDGRLWLLRDIYAAQTAWAPRHVGKGLRLSRLGAFDAALGAIRAALPSRQAFEGTHRRSRLARPRRSLLRLEDAQTGRRPPAAQADYRAFNEDP